MKTIKFFHPEETFTYYIEKCFCKVIYSGQQYQLLVEVFSTEDLDHLEEDSLQNEFPQVILSVDDFPVPFKSVSELSGKTILIPHSFVELEDEEGDLEEVYYTNLNFTEDNYGSEENELYFYTDASGNLCLRWRGKVLDMVNEADELIPFELECTFSSSFLGDDF